jgi:hypothetical protein
VKAKSIKAKPRNREGRQENLLKLWFLNPAIAFFATFACFARKMTLLFAPRTLTQNSRRSEVKYLSRDSHYE